MSFPRGVFAFDPQPPSPPKPPKTPRTPKTPASGTGGFTSFKKRRSDPSTKASDSPLLQTSFGEEEPSVFSRRKSDPSAKTPDSPRLGLFYSKKQSPTRTARKPLYTKPFSKKKVAAKRSPSPATSVDTSFIERLADPSWTLELRRPDTSHRSEPRPRHIPIIIPDYATSSPDLSLLTPTVPRADPKRPKYVEIKIPDWYYPVVKGSATPPQVGLRQSVFLDPFADIYEKTLGDMAQPTRDTDRTNLSSSHLPLGGTNGNNVTNGVRPLLSSAHSSQVNLNGRHVGYESASEAESSQDEGDESQANVRAGEHTSTTTQTATPMSSNSNVSRLSGLVCNVQRTSGKEPPPLVGASTTILGDKLYVFGGRKSSRTNSQISSSLYELDLIKRHWTKVEAKGDIPPPRYFHTVCALGDTKLVCYGGMSNAPQTADATPNAQGEIIVMSDIHIFDVPAKSWMRINYQEGPRGRYAHCATILPSSAVFASTTAPMSAVHHNPSTGNSNQGTLGIALDGTGGAEMVVVGGQDSSNQYIEQISVFNLRSLKWTSTTPLGRSCGTYRSVVAPLGSMKESQIGAGPYYHDDEDEDEPETLPVGSGAPMIIYSNYNFLDVKLELQVRQVDGKLVEKPIQGEVSPPGLRFPNGGVIANHFIVSGTFLTASVQEYALWALDLRTLTWGRIDVGGNMFSHGSWNRGVLWSRRNAFVILGNRRRSLVDDYHTRRVNFTNVCLVELEAFGLYDNPRRMQPTSDFRSLSSNMTHEPVDTSAAGRRLLSPAQELGTMLANARELADMDFLAIDGTRIPVNSRLIARRWGQHFINMMRESVVSGTETDNVTLRPTTSGHPSRVSCVTITTVNAGGTTTASVPQPELLDARSAPPQSRPRLFFLPHTTETIQALVHYLYTSTLPSPPSPLATPQVLCSLLQLARPYKIDGLLETTIECLHESLDDRNAAAIFNAAAMGAGGGDGIHPTLTQEPARQSTIPIRNASLLGLDGNPTNAGPAGRTGLPLRIDTEAANGRNPSRLALRPGQSMDDSSEDEPPGSAGTDTSMSDMESTMNKHAVWKGEMSAVVGLQKRGLRGLMEGRRMRQRGAGEGDPRVGLGIA